MAISSAHSVICFNSSCNWFEMTVFSFLLGVGLAIWLCIRKLFCFKLESPNRVEKGLVASVGDGIGVVLGVRTGGVGGSEIKLDTVG